MAAEVELDPVIVKRGLAHARLRSQCPDSEFGVVRSQQGFPFFRAIDSQRLLCWTLLTLSTVASFAGQSTCASR